MAALYQRARPVTFDELVGQEHVKDVLEAAVRADRTTHAYLFSGPRGVGKTTTARLLAMAVNCEDDTEGATRPCGRCESCRLVRSVSHPDVVELDAASNNSVEDVRELQAHIGLASMRGGKRVWILDEAHMLSKAAANALLKTLEEPPAGLIFVLATTEPEKLPPTILSRCQHFRFRRLADAEIVSKLTRLCADAGVEVDPAALELIARSADGGMRDAESLLERLMVTATSVSLEAAEQALGLPPQERLARMGAALLAHDLESLLAAAADLYRDGYAPRTVAEQLARTLRGELHAALAGAASWGAGAVQDLLALLHALDDESERFVRQNDLYALEVALIKSLNAATAAVGPFAAAASVPTASAAPTADAGRPVRSEARAHGADAPAGPATGRRRTATRDAGSHGAEPAAPAAPSDTSAPDPVGRTQASAEAGATPTAAGDAAPAAFSWHAVRSAAGPQLKAFLHPAQVEVEGRDVTIRYDERHAFHRTQLTHKLDEFEALLAAVAGPGYRVNVTGAATARPRQRSAPQGQGAGRSDESSSDEPSATPAKTAAGIGTPAAADAETEGDASTPQEAGPDRLEVSELELAGFDEEPSAWHDDPGSDGEAPVGSATTTSGAGAHASVERQAAELLKDHGQAFAEVQELFPGRVTDVVSDARTTAVFGEDGAEQEAPTDEAVGGPPADPDEAEEQDDLEDDQPDEAQGRITFN